MSEALTFDQLPSEVNQLRQDLGDVKSLLLRMQEQLTPKPPVQQLLTVDELAELLDLTKPTIYSNFSRGLLPGGCKQGKRLYFDKQVIIDWIKSGRKLTNAEIEAKAETYLSNKKGR